MSGEFINLTAENIATEHLCCAIAGQKHQAGVEAKRNWLGNRIKEGHVFRKLATKGKVFIEYAPLEKAWVPVEGNDFLYIYCLWVAGSFKGQGHGQALLEYCINDARSKGKSGVCVLAANQKRPFLADPKFFAKYGFEVVDRLSEGYELLALSFDGNRPIFSEKAKGMQIPEKELTIYYSLQCPFIPNCIEQVKEYCQKNVIPLNLRPIDSLAKAKNVPALFNNWAVFYQGAFVTNQLLNEKSIMKILTE